MKEFVGRFWNHSAHAYLGLMIRLVVGAVFIYAAIPKIARPADFAWSVALYQMLHYSRVNFFAVVLPWVELIAALALIVGLWTRGAAVVINALLVMFVVALLHAASHRIEMTTCGCFSQAGAKALTAHRQVIGRSLLYRDIAMFFAVGYVWLFDGGRFGVDGWRKKHET